MNQKPFAPDRRRIMIGGVTVFGGLYLMSERARAAAALSRAARDMTEPDKTFLLIELTGGNDGLSTIVPYAEDDYHKSRARTGIKKEETLRLDDYRGFHPNLSELKELYDQGGLAIVEGTGYPHPNHSHFTSLDIWHTAHETGRASGDGWIGKLLQNLYPDEVRAPHAVFVGQRTPYSMQSGTHPVVCFDSPTAYRWASDAGAIAASRKEMSGENEGALIAKIRSVVRNAWSSSEEMRRAVASYKPRTEYPEHSFGQDLRTAAALLQARIGCRVLAVAHEGYDTHADQKQRHDTLMTELSTGLSAFLKDVKGTESGDRIVVLVYSEFGRRVADNASLGTDHGTAGPMFAAGTPVRGGLYGKHPSLQDLDEGDLKFTTDFRRAYASVIQGWLGIDHERVLGAKYETFPFIKA